MSQNLPIFSVLDELAEQLKKTKRAVLTAPPGAGKSTAVPINLINDPAFSKGKVIMLEPRRIAVKQVAARMAQTLNEPIGKTVGYRIRGETKCSELTKIEVVTDGILIRMIQADQELKDVSTIIFDEFHERSLNADLGLAFCLETANVLRSDLKILVMSATLEVNAVSKLMQNAPIIKCQGKSFSVTPHWQKLPQTQEEIIPKAISEVILKVIKIKTGSILVFLPGEAEIIKVAASLKGQVPTDCRIFPLYGRLDFKDQQNAIKPLSDGRKIVLATNVAETSLTIEGIDHVIDSGLSKRSIYDSSSGMARLVTQKISKSEADQRMGRAGRLAPGNCYKLWSKSQDGSFPEFAPAEIEKSDLTPFVLELALWGGNVDDLALLTKPNKNAISEAHKVLQMLEAIDEKLQITKQGRSLSKIPLHPRLSKIILSGAQDAPLLASILSDADPLEHSRNTDINLRLDAVKKIQTEQSNQSGSIKLPIAKRILKEASRLSKYKVNKSNYTVGQLVALAYPDRIGKRRDGQIPRYILSNGKGAVLAENDPLRSEPFIVACSLDGDQKEAKIRYCAPITLSEIKELFEEQIISANTCYWSTRHKKVIAQCQDKLGHLNLHENPWKNVPNDIFVDAMLDGIKQLGFFHSKNAKYFLARVRMAGDKFPDMSDKNLHETVKIWLAPFLQNIKSAEDWKKFDDFEALQSLLNWKERQLLDKLVPAHFVTPLQRKININYENNIPEISIRIQEMYGQKAHPTSAGLPIRITFLSPAGRKIQTTTDIVSFWESSYEDVRKDMRGRYPKHFWPERPADSQPTLNTKNKI